MLKLEYSPFTMKPLTLGGGLQRLMDRHGAIVRITWPDGKLGYSSLMPREERHDAPLVEHFADFKQGRISYLLEQSISMARTDAQFRSQGKNAFDGAKKVRNNYFISEALKVDTKMMTLIKDQNFVTLMIDVGQDLSAEVDAVRRILKMTKFLVRLNFNARADWPSFERFMSVIEPGLKPRIEFVVDPMPYDQESWRDAARFAPVAIDSQLPYMDWSQPDTLPQLRAIMIRPTVVDTDDIVAKALALKSKLVVTSSFEHPVAVAHSTLIASDLNTKYPLQVLDHDCLYQNFYVPHAFSGLIATQGPFILSASGKGIGFTRQLDEQDWKSI
jgi:O-succinylbenzoate synthase